MTLTRPRRLAMDREIAPVNYIAVAVERRLAAMKMMRPAVTSTICE